MASVCSRATGFPGARRPSTCTLLARMSRTNLSPGTPRMKRIAFTLAVAATAVAAHAEPAIVYDAGGKFDKSFNEAAYNGIERFKKETGTGYLDFEISNDTQREQALRRMAQKGADPVI